MEYLYSFMSLHPLLSLAQLAFTVWMLLDAYRRQVDYFWFWVILFAPAIGPLVYFFAIKAGDFQGLRGWFQPRASLQELQYRADQTPSLANRLALAERLIELHEHDEALAYLEAALAQEPDNCQVLYFQALCHMGKDLPQGAVPLLERLYQRDRRWSDYSGWRLLVEARVATGDTTGALESCRDLVKQAPTLQHRCLLAQRLLAEGRTVEARHLLDQSLQELRYAPSPVRRRSRPWVTVARRLQKQC